MKLRLIKSSPSVPSHTVNSISGSHVASIKLHNVLVSYDARFSLQCDSADLAGNVIAVLGHNGAGKSTLLKATLDLLPLKRGSISLHLRSNGCTIPLSPARDLAFCPESGSVFADISVESYIKLWCRLRYNNPRYYLNEGAKYIELLNIGPLLDRLGRELSKGQRRRVQTAIGFFMRPKLFLLDEPFDGLDVQKTHELSEIIEDHSNRMAFILSSHRMDVIERLADTIVVLHQGGILTQGSVEEVSKSLASSSLTLTLRDGAESALGLLKEHFAGYFSTKVGGHVIITGHEMNELGIIGLLSSHGLSVVQSESHNPTLVDAMNYFLRKTSLPSEA